jgi:hypothetical protein
MKPAAIYFALVFGAGFMLGPIRQLWLVPRVGVRAAELMEIPVMLLAVFYAARFIHRRFPGAQPVLTGVAALVFLLAAEIALGMILTGAPLAEVLLDRDPVSGAAYYAALGIFAAMPWWLKRG